MFNQQLLFALFLLFQQIFASSNSDLRRNAFLSYHGNTKQKRSMHALPGSVQDPAALLVNKRRQHYLLRKYYETYRLAQSVGVEKHVADHYYNNYYGKFLREP
ncbi:Oidioi.mRNA.OKI2018_I69.chr2.g5377.t1.cds [Oikopleura dioica]|uniref:Oidioi.mRNA.OKI2018_I69.chr2.g5377.t1.cds n=1 Tax=Oikopleura dioica TaxID=34765 RepID=A0ABN7T5T2_OIKDI|nr:Oidioi.mRNA.OKI2018_I69.chr2.g5377.t1.cds [Oikopleura dioica]